MINLFSYFLYYHKPQVVDINMPISNELIIILLCAFHFFVKKMKKPSKKVQV